MGTAARKKTQKCTYSDYLSWDDGKRWEIINGNAYNMSPAPIRIHQKISMELSRQLANQLVDKTYAIYPAQFDVRLPLADEKEEDIKNVLQPDTSVICDPNKLDEKGCIGAPDFIIEILSQGNLRRDRLEKFNLLYEMTGVKEYWLVSPEEQMVEVFILGPDGSYGRPGMYTETDTVKIDTLENIGIDLSAIFKDTKKMNVLL